MRLWTTSPVVAGPGAYKHLGAGSYIKPRFMIFVVQPCYPGWNPGCIVSNAQRSFEHSALLAGARCTIFAFYQPPCENLPRISFGWRAKHSTLLKKRQTSFFSFLILGVLIFYLLTALLAQKHLDLLADKKGKLQRRGPQSSSKWLTTSLRKNL